MIGLGLAAILLGDTISYENRGIRLELFLKDLSKRAGIEFHCPAYLNDEVIVASFQNQLLETVKTQLARVINGAWEKKDSGWWLIQGDSQKKEEQNIFNSARSKILQDEIEQAKAVAPKAMWTQQDAAQYWADSQASRVRTGEGQWTAARRRAFRLRSPESRCGLRLSLLLKPDMFDTDPGKPDDRCFAIRGLKSHVELPVDATNALTQYAEEHEFFTTLAGSNVLIGRPSHVEIAVANDEVPIPQFMFYDQNWLFVGGAIPAAFYRNYAAKPETFALSPETKTIQAIKWGSPVSEQLMKDFQALKIAETFANARTTDPLGILQGRCWVDCAHSFNKPLLVNLEDDPGSRRPRTYVPTIEQDEPVVGMKRIDADGWILGKPRNPQRNRSWRLDRSLIERAARSGVDNRATSIEDGLALSDFLCYVDLYTTGIPNRNFFEAAHNGYSFAVGALGTLPLGQIQDIFDGASIPATSLPSRGQAYLIQLYNWGNLNELSSLKENKELACSRFALPNGLEGMFLSATVAPGLLFSFVDDVSDLMKDGDGLSQAMLASEMKKAMQGNTALLTKKFVVSTIQTVNVKISMNGREFNEPQELCRQDSPEYTWSTLPDSIKKQVLGGD